MFAGETCTLSSPLQTLTVDNNPVDSVFSSPAEWHRKDSHQELATPADLRKVDSRLLSSIPRTRILLDHKLDTTHFERPLFRLPNPAKTSPREYLPHYENPYGQRVVEWQREMLGRNATPRTSPAIAPRSPDAITLVALFYPDDPKVARRPFEVYLSRIKLFAISGQQMIIYCAPSIAQRVRDLRPNDPHWLVVDEFETIWDIPNNRHQRHNFTETQPAHFSAFTGSQWTVHGVEPRPEYNAAYLTAAYNAKAFITYDAVMRNPFGSERFMYVDSGLLTDDHVWTEEFMKGFIDTTKIDRAIKIARTSGVVFAEYDRHPDSRGYGYQDIEHEAWTTPSKLWQLRPWISYAWVGDSLGMLNLSLKWMQTVEDMGSNGLYVGREEFFLAHIAVRYPNTIFTIPSMSTWHGRPQTTYWDQTGKLCHSTAGGPDAVPTIQDPIATLFCPGYEPRHQNLEAGEHCTCKTCETPLY